MPASPISRPEDSSPGNARDRIAALEQDLANLRKGMVQQLTASGRLLKTVFTIDQDYFGGRFAGHRTVGEAPDPLRDLALATQIAEAVADELQGSSAFADSPLLRDAIANLLQTFETVREESLVLEQTTIDVLALPVKPEPGKNHQFPEDNPLACLAESAEVVHDLVKALRRVKDRIGGIRLMLNEAERGRQEAENAVTPVDLDAIAGAVTDELHRTQADLSDLARHLEEQDASLADLQASLAEAKARAGLAEDLHAAAHAELRGLAAEIARQTAQRFAAGSPAPELGTLCRALADDDSADRLGGAAEAVVLLLADGNPTAAEPSSQANARLIEAERALAEREATCATLRSERDRAHGDLEQERLAVARTTAQLTAVQSQLDQARLQGEQQAAATNARDALQAELATLRAAVQRSEATCAALQTEYDRTTAELEKERNYAARAAGDLAAVREQLAALQNQTSQRDVTLQQAQARHAEQADQARHALEHVTNELSALRRKADEDARTLRERDRSLASLRDTVANLDQARDAALAAHQRAEEALTATKAALAARSTTLELTQRQLADGETAFAILRHDHAILTAERDRLAQVVDSSAGEQAQARRALEARLAELERHAAELAAQNADLTARCAADAEALAALRQEADNLRVTSERTTAELAHVRGDWERARSDVRQQTAQADELRRRCAEIEADLRRVTAEHDEHQRRLQAELASARREASDACDARDAAAASILQARRDNERLAQDLARTTATLASGHATDDTRVSATQAAQAELEQRLATTAATADALRAELEQVRREAAAAAQAGERTIADLTYTLAREQSLAQERVELLAERKRLTTALDTAKAELAHLRTANADDQRSIQARLAAQDAATRTVTEERDRLARDLAEIRPRLERHDSDVGALTDERNRLADQVTKLTQERDQLDRRLSELDTTCTALRSELDATATRLRANDADVDRLRLAEQEARRISDDATAKAARLTGDVAVLRERLSAQARSHDQAIARASDAVAAAERAAEERAVATTSLSQTSAERDRLKQALDGERSERALLQQRFDESQAQTATKLADAQRLLLEARTVHQRLEDEANRLRADVARLDTVVTQQQRERTATLATAERVTELERLLAAEREAASNLRAQLAQRPTRDDTPADTGEVATLRAALAAAEAKRTQADQARRDTRSRCEELLRAARDAVAAAKQQQERTEADHQVVIADLSRQIQELQFRTAPQL